MYKDINAFSSPVYRRQAYYTTDATYTIQYYGDAKADAELTDDSWRVQRVRYVTAWGAYFDTSRAINDIDTVAAKKRFDAGKWSNAFIFKATNLAYANALSYNDA